MPVYRNKSVAESQTNSKKILFFHDCSKKETSFNSKCWIIRQIEFSIRIQSIVKMKKMRKMRKKDKN